MSDKTKVGLGTETQVDAPASRPSGVRVGTAIGPAVATSDTVLATSAAGASASMSAALSRRSAPAVGSAIGAAGEPTRGDTIGRFVVLGVLGSGGMGQVYSAYDPHLDRKVAIKLLWAEVVHDGTAEAGARLLREAQAMAKISHPNVIRVHEVGTFRDQVYLAMEFADGGTLRSWLKDGPSSRDIIATFLAAGRGLAAAHAVGLVHRDFKPDNVLLDQDGGVRVTDFGLVSTIATATATTADADAAATADAPGAANVRAATEPAPAQVPHVPAGVPELSRSGTTPLSQDLTRTGTIMGTPTYMAPEQFTGATTTVRTDQFAFCVSLYEALYGSRPFRGESYVELSTNVLLGEVAPAPKGARVPGWIRRVLLRGLAIEPANRFSSMTDLLAALERDPSRARRRALAITGAVAVLAAGGVAAVALRSNATDVCGAGRDRFGAIWNPARRDTIQAAFAASTRPQAAASFAKASEMIDRWGDDWQHGYVEACRDTRVRAEQSEHLLDLRMQCLTRRLEDARATIDVLAAGGTDAIDHVFNAVRALPSVAPCADRAGLIAEVAPPETPIAREQVAIVHASLDAARAQRNLARYKQALEIATPALATARTLGYAPLTGDALYMVGDLQHELGDQAAATTLDEAMTTAAAAGDASRMIDATAELVLVLTADTARFDAAEMAASLAEALAAHAHPPVDVVVRLEDVYGALLDKRGDPKGARSHLDRALALADKELPPDSLATTNTLTQLGNLDKSEGHFEDARGRLERVLATYERVYGKDHPAVASALNNLGRVALAEGKAPAAKAYFERALAIRTAALGPDHPDVGESLLNLGTFYSDQADHASAKKYYEQALAVWTKVYGPDSVELAAPEMNLGTVAEATADYPSARAHLDKARALLEAAHGPDHPAVAGALEDLAVVAQDEHHLDDSLALHERALHIYEKVYGPDHPDVADELANIASIYKQQNKLDLAEAMSKRGLDATAKAYGADHPHMAMALTNLGNLQEVRDEHDAALASFARAQQIFETKFGPDHPYVSYPLMGTADILVRIGRAAEALPMAERALAIRTAANMPGTLLPEARFVVAKARFAAERTQHARAVAEAKQALAEYKAGGDATNAAEVASWLVGKH